MKTVYRLVIGVLAIGCVTLGGTTIVLLQRTATRSLPGTPAPADTTDAALLRKLLAERETAYFALKNELDRVKQAAPSTADGSSSVVAKVSTNAAAGAGRGRGESYLEQLRTTDPERYKQIQTEREQHRQQHAAELQQQFDKLDARLQTATTQTEADLVTQIANTLAHMDDLRQQFQQVRDLPEDQRNPAMQQLRDDSIITYQKLADLHKQDQVQRLQQFGSQLGQNPAAFAKTVQQIIADTNSRRSR